MDIDRRAIHRPKLFELVADELEGLIRSGRLQPGDALPSERNIMEAYSIGRPAVREALFALQNRGLIRIEAGRRAKVITPSVEGVLLSLTSVVEMMVENEQNLRNLHDARTFIESAIARYAASHASKAEIDELDRILTANEEAIGDRDAFRSTDLEFHRALFSVPRNPVFEAVHVGLMNWLHGRWVRMALDAHADRIAYRGHRRIFDAIKHHDPDGADAAMKSHLVESWKVWSTYTPA